MPRNVEGRLILYCSGASGCLTAATIGRTAMITVGQYAAHAIVPEHTKRRRRKAMQRQRWGGRTSLPSISVPHASPDRTVAHCVKHKSPATAPTGAEGGPCICTWARRTPRNPSRSRSGAMSADHRHKKWAREPAAAIPRRPERSTGAQEPFADTPCALRGKDSPGRQGGHPPRPAETTPSLPPHPAHAPGGLRRLQGDRAGPCARRRPVNRPGGTRLAFPCLQQHEGHQLAPESTLK